MGQRGSSMVSQCRNALSRHSSIHSGSSFLAEMSRTTSSESPGGTISCSTSVMKPNLYSWLANCSMVLVEVVSMMFLEFLPRL